MSDNNSTLNVIIDKTEFLYNGKMEESRALMRILFNNRNGMVFTSDLQFLIVFTANSISSVLVYVGWIVP
jgi:hypothetical protein